MKYTKNARRYVRDARSNYWDDVYNHFKNERSTDAFLDIAADIVDRVNFDNITEDDAYEEVWQAIDDGLIYSEDQWEVMKHYQSPDEANWESAIEEFSSDIASIVEEIASK